MTIAQMIQALQDADARACMTFDLWAAAADGTRRTLWGRYDSATAEQDAAVLALLSCGYCCTDSTPRSVYPAQRPAELRAVDAAAAELRQWTRQGMDALQAARAAVAERAADAAIHEDCPAVLEALYLGIDPTEPYDYYTAEDDGAPLFCDYCAEYPDGM